MEQLESSSIQYQLNSEQNVDTDEPPPKRSEKTINFENKLCPNVFQIIWNNWKFDSYEAIKNNKVK
jgi:hypothetical protein